MASSAGTFAQRLGRRTQLPPIFCPDCKWRKVMELISRTSNNPDKVFFTCPNQKKGKPNCEFYLWEEEYVDYLRMNHGYTGNVAQHGGGDGAALIHTGGEDEEEGALIHTEVGETVKEGELVATELKQCVHNVQQMCVLVKVLVAIAVCVLVAIICNLVAFLLK